MTTKYPDDADFLGDVTVAGTLAVTGAVTYSAAIESTSAQGSLLTFSTAETEETALSGATVSATDLIPAGAVVVGVVARVTTLITGATTFQIGDGTDADKWGDAIAVAADTTTSAADFTAAGPTLYAAATDVVLTATGSDFTAGAVRLTVHYYTVAAATA